MKNSSYYSNKAKLNESIKLLDDFKAGKSAPNVTDQQLWEAQKIKQVKIFDSDILPLIK